MAEMRMQCSDEGLACGSITDMKMLVANLDENCIPPGIFEMWLDDYPRFL